MEKYNLHIKAKLDTNRTLNKVMDEYNVSSEQCYPNGHYAEVVIDANDSERKFIPAIDSDIWVAGSSDCQKFFTNDEVGEFFRFAVVSLDKEVTYYSKASLYRMVRESIASTKRVSRGDKIFIKELLHRMEMFSNNAYNDIARSLNYLSDELLNGGTVYPINFINPSNYGI